MSELIRFTLYKHFVQGEEYNIKEVAKRLGVSVSLVYKWCEGQGIPSVVQCIQLYYATDEADFLDMMVGETDYTITHKTWTRELSGRDMKDELLKSHETLSRLSNSFRDAMADGRLSRREIELLTTLADENLKRAEEMVATVKDMSS